MAKKFYTNINAPAFVKDGGTGLNILLDDGTTTVLGDLATVSDIPSLTGYLKNIVEDTTPELGGNLDANNKSITSLNDINFAGIALMGIPSDKYMRFGATNPSDTHVLVVGDTFEPAGGRINFRYGGGGMFFDSVVSGQVNRFFMDSAGNANFKTSLKSPLIIKTGGTNDDILLGDGTTTSLSGLPNDNTTYTAGNGLNLTGTTFNHLTTSGWKHIPTNGSSGQFLTWLATGEAKWTTVSLFTPTNLLNDYGFNDQSSNWNTAYGWGNHSGLYAPTGRSLTINGTSQTLAANRTWNITTITGNAGSATTLQTARTINGTSFNGSSNITTSLWGTSRNISIGGTSKAVNGSANVTWSTTEIGITKTNIDALNIDAATLGGTAKSGFALSSHTHNIGDINTTGTPSSSTYLRGDGTWATVTGGSGINNVVEDTTPELGGNLDANGKDITDVGELGIGTNSPVRSLQVDGNASFGGQDTSTLGQVYIRTKGDTKDDGLIMGNFPFNASARWWIDANDVQRLDNGSTAQNDIALNGAGNGKVGIGTLTFTEKLTVNGNVRANKFIAVGKTSDDILLGNGTVTSLAAIGGFTPTNLFTDYGFTDNSSNWNAAYGWGNHTSAGYLKNVVEDTTPELGGDLDGKGNNIGRVGDIDADRFIATGKTGDDILLGNGSTTSLSGLPNDNTQLITHQAGGTYVDASSNSGYNYSFGGGPDNTELCLMYDGTIDAASIQCAYPGTANVQIYINGIGTGIQLNLSDTKQDYISGKSYPVVAGDVLSFKTRVSTGSPARNPVIAVSIKTKS